jgi:tRNA modification GTPase
MEDTIAAIATAVGTSAINIIKVSGPDSINIVNKVFKGKNLTEVPTHTINYGFIIDGEEKIDEVLVSVFHAPNTYTGENIVEINCHGGIAATNKILELVLTNGCRLAERGEFLKRAFLNGKKDLLEVEGVSDLINAENEKARKMGIKSITGELSKMINDLRNKLLSIIANIEVNIDYPEYEDAIEYTNEILKTNIKEIKTALEKILKQSEKGKIIKNGINIGIIGKPNVGKSSLLNKLLEEEKAIVTDIEGTTRDIVEGKINLNGITLNLIDTAGIRETNNLVEKIGVEKSKKIIEESDLLIAIFDGSKTLTIEDEEIIKNIQDKKVIVLINKTDLPTKLPLEKLNNFLTIKISIKNNEGINDLLDKIAELFNLKIIEEEDYTYLSNSRQIALIKTCVKLANEIYESNEKNTPVDLIQIDIQRLWETLGEIIGSTYKEELLDEIFSKFCLGK